MRRTKSNQVVGDATKSALAEQSRKEEWKEKRRGQVRAILAKLPDSLRERKRVLANCSALLPIEEFEGEALWFQVLQAQSFLNLHVEVAAKGLIANPIVLRAVYPNGRKEP